MSDTQKVYFQFNADGFAKEITKNQISKVCEDVTYYSYETDMFGTIGIYMDDNGKLKGLPPNKFVSSLIFNHHAMVHPEYTPEREAELRNWYRIVGDVVLECDSETTINKVLQKSGSLLYWI